MVGVESIVQRLRRLDIERVFWQPWKTIKGFVNQVSSQELKEKIAKYSRNAGGMTQRELACLERDIWTLASSADDFVVSRQNNRKEWLRRTLGCSNHHSQCRYTLLNLGVLAEPFWRLLNSGEISLSKVEEVVREAKMQQRQTLVPLRDCLDQVMAEYRKGNGAVRRRVKRKTGVRVENKKLRQDLRARVDEYLAWRLENTPEVDRERVSLSFDSMIRDALEKLSGDVSKAAQREKDEAYFQRQVEYHDVILACETLGIDVPGPAQPVNIDIAKRRKRSLAKKFHPDAAKTEEHRGEYDQVIKAFDTIRKYSEQLMGA
jgi:hypothetical protein